MKAVFTIVAKNYMASALSLAESVHRYEDDVDFYIVLADEWDNDSDKDSINEKVVLAKDIVGIPDYYQKCFMYDVVEFSTYVKPYFFLELLRERGYSKVVYLDPDTYLYSDLSEVWDGLSQFDCVVTPHIVDIGTISVKDKESHILNRGVYNFGFLGLNDSGDCIAFLEWWAKMLDTNCIRSDRLFVDQKWGDFVNVYISKTFVLKKKKYNIANWNIQERKLSCENNSVFVEDKGKREQICFVHYSQFKMQSADEYIKKYMYDAIDDECIIAFRVIYDEYEKSMKRNGYDYWSTKRYAYNNFDFNPNAKKIELLHRRIYRELVLKDKASDYLNPFLLKGAFYNKLICLNVINGEKKDYSYAPKKVRVSAPERKLNYLWLSLIRRLFGFEKMVKYSRTISGDTSIEGLAMYYGRML